ncbi:rolling circle replication-associated protein [Sphingomonas sp.]|jgi:hypothetical protein|uniref:rolling circle replication-associated protein n=1 Tax=Sphingomonas sp. TaxID=28214 RepID=UPI00262ED65D|nr:hypothetical protein [Sphingomonas sp.]MDK2768015.1 hypothetical protein [Sphingomonas sp.]
MVAISDEKSVTSQSGNQVPSTREGIQFPVKSMLAGHSRGPAPTSKLRDDQVKEAFAAAEFAMTTLPLNRFLTINWERAGIANAAEATRLFLKLASDFCRTHGSELAYLWTLEHTERVGVHAHIMMHVPHELGARFGQRQRGWFKRVGGRSAKGNLKTKHVGHSSRAYLHRDRDGGAFAKDHRSVAEYILKCCSFEVKRELGFQRQTHSGAVAGQRYGRSQNLGPKTRRSFAEQSSSRRST